MCHISDTLGCASCATFLFLPHFDVICDLLLNRRTTTWNLFVNCIMSYSNGVLNLLNILNNTNRTIAALITAIKSETKKETLINSNFLKRVFYEKSNFNNFPRKVDSFLVDLTDLTSYKSGVVDNLFSLPTTNNELTLFGLNKSKFDIPVKFNQDDSFIMLCVVYKGVLSVTINDNNNFCTVVYKK